MSGDAITEIRAAAISAANCDDGGGIWCYVGWAEKSNDSGVLAAWPYDDPECKPLTGRVEYDTDKLYTETIAACEDDSSGGVRARYIALACPANIIAILDRLTAAESSVSRLTERAEHWPHIAARIREVMDERDGFWKTCSGCCESVEGYVNPKDYPHSDVFGCALGGGCGDCGGIGAVWDNIDYSDVAESLLTAPSHGRDAGELAEEIANAKPPPFIIERITAAILSERAEAERMRKALEEIKALDEASGYELTVDRALQAVAIAARALASPSPAGKEQTDG